MLTKPFKILLKCCFLNGSEQKIFKHAGSSKLFLESAAYFGTIFKITNDTFLYFIEIFVFPL